MVLGHIVECFRLRWNDREQGEFKKGNQYYQILQSEKKKETLDQQL